MKNVKLFVPVLILCLIFASTAYSAKPSPTPSYVYYYGYATLCNVDANNNQCKIVSDNGTQYIDRHNPGSNGDRIEVSLIYNNRTKKYDLQYFTCFLGKPEPPWSSTRRVHFGFDIASGQNVASQLNQAVANMLLYNVTNDDRRGNSVGSEYHLTDNSVHLTIQNRMGSEFPYPIAAFLVDKSDTATDPEAITQTDFGDTPRYWTALEGIALGGGETDAEDHIAFFLFKNQLTFSPIEYEGKIPITWVVTPTSGQVNMHVRRITDPDDPVYTFAEEDIWTYPSLPFRLIVSKNSLTGRTLAPPKQANAITDAWGSIKSR